MDNADRPCLDEVAEDRRTPIRRSSASGCPRSGVQSLSTRPTIAGYHGRQLTLKADAIGPSA